MSPPVVGVLAGYPQTPGNCETSDRPEVWVPTKHLTGAARAVEVLRDQERQRALSHPGGASGDPPAGAMWGPGPDPGPGKGLGETLLKSWWRL